MKKYICLTNRYYRYSGFGAPVNGESYNADYTWGSRDYTVEELANENKHEWQLIQEDPKEFSIESKNIHLRKAMIEDLEKLGYKFDSNDIESKRWFIIKSYLDVGSDEIYLHNNFNKNRFTLPQDYKKALEFAKDQMELFNKKKEHEYVPFTFDDREMFRNKWVKENDSMREFMVTGISELGIKLSGNYHTYREAIIHLEFTDGTPFGKLKKIK